MTPTRAERKQIEYWRGVRSRVVIEYADVIATVLVLAFLWITWEVVRGRADIVLLQTYMPIIAAVVGGYFVEQGVREFRKPPPPPLREEGELPPI